MNFVSKQAFFSFKIAKFNLGFFLILNKYIFHEEKIAILLKAMLKLHQAVNEKRKSITKISCKFGIGK